MGRRTKFGICAWTLLLCVLIQSKTASSASTAQKPQDADFASVTAFSPRGVSEPSSQIVVTFNKQMVPLKSPNQNTDLFAVACTPAMTGQARWNDGNQWIYTFSTRLSRNQLPGGTSCKVSFNYQAAKKFPLKIKGPSSFQFVVDGPNIVSSRPSMESPVDEEQVFVLKTDAPVDLQTVQQNARFVSRQKGSRIDVRIFEGEQRRRIIDLVYGEHERKSTPDDQIIVLQARDRFASGEELSFVWGPGILAVGGKQGRQGQLVYKIKARKNLEASLSCTRENDKAPCSPFADIRMKFSSAIPISMAKNIVLKNGTQTFAAVMPRADDYDDDGDRDYSPLDESETNRLVFKGPFPAEGKFEVVIPPGIQDDAGRPLANAKDFPMAVETAAYPPLAKFPARFGIIESAIKPIDLPVTVRNLEAEVLARKIGGGLQNAVQLTGSDIHLGVDQFPQIVKWINKINFHDEADDRAHSIFDPSDLHQASQVQIPIKENGKAFEVVGIPLKTVGFHVVEIESQILGESLLGQQVPMYVPTSVLVTGMAAHLKTGSENALVWVTSLEDGKPVAGASVGLHDCTGKKVWSGVSDPNGLTSIGVDPLKAAKVCPAEAKSYGFFVTAALDDDFTFVSSQWTQGLEAYRYGIRTSGGDNVRGGIIAHTIADRPMYRAGEVVSMKHLIRKLSRHGFSAVDESNLPKYMVLSHVGSDTKYVAPLSWDTQSFSSKDAKWNIPKDAKLGSYSVYLTNSTGKDWYYSSYPSGTIQVEEYKTPTSSATISFPKEILINPAQVETNLGLGYLNGGPASNKAVIFSYYISPKVSFEIKGFDDFRFSAKPIVPGLRPETSGPSEDTSIKPIVQNLKLDAAGAAHIVMDKIGTDVVPRNLVARIEYKDDDRTQIYARVKDLWPAHQIVGIKVPRWNYGGSKARFEIAVSTPEGTPVAGANPNIETFVTKYLQHRKRDVGGLYVYNGVYSTEPVNTRVQCDGPTNTEGITNCSLQSPVSGQIYIQASITDNEGRTTFAVGDVNVDGPDNGNFRTENSDRMDLLPTKQRYEVGETAILQVRMPFPEATALITVEREGVLSAHVEHLTSNKPHVSVPITSAYSPNVFVSAFVVSGRVPGSEPTEKDVVDLGKPSFKLGLAELFVNWKPHALDVKVSTDRASYAPRSQKTANVVTATFKVNTQDGAALPPHTEIAVAVVDEGLLQLKSNQSWDVLTNMMQNRPLDVQTATAQMQVVGKRHYGLKAVPTGGGGGQQNIRELFDTILFWSERVPVDANGMATVKFTTNDSLTKFRIVAVATGGLNRFGTGETSFITNQDLIVQPAVPTLAREGDRYTLRITLRNTTSAAMDATAKGIVTFLDKKGVATQVEVAPKAAPLAANQSTELSLAEITVPKGAVAARYQIDVTTADDAQNDQIALKQIIQPAINVQTQMSTLQKVRGATSTAVQLPDNAVGLDGGVAVSLSPSLAGSLDTVKLAMMEYPFDFLEYRLSRAVVLQSAEEWQAVMQKLPAFVGSNGLLKFYPGSKYESVALTAYVLALANESGSPVPEIYKTKMIEGLKSFVSGRLRTGFESDNSLRIRAMEALSRYQALDASRVATVETKNPALLKTSTIVDLLNIARRIPGTGLNAPALEKSLRDSDRMTVIGNSTVLNAQTATDYWMSSKDKAFAELLLLRMSTAQQRAQWSADFPRMIMGFLKQQRRGAWDSTFANAWGAMALRTFAKHFEKVPVKGRTDIALAAQNESVNWQINPSGENFAFAWPSAARADLKVSHIGAGEPWALIATRAAVQLVKPVSAGFNLEKTIVPVPGRQAVPGKWTVGDVAEVHLKIKGQARVAQVALRDPVPAGCLIRRAAGDNSAASTTGGWQWPDYEEFATDSYRAYYDSVGGTEFEVVYQIDFNTPGTFKVPSTRIEAIYDTEIFGEAPNDDIVVNP